MFDDLKKIVSPMTPDLKLLSVKNSLDSTCHDSAKELVKWLCNVAEKFEVGHYFRNSQKKVLNACSLTQ